MDTQRQEGRGLVITVISATIALSVVAIVVYLITMGPKNLAQQIVRLILTVVLCVFLYRGASWARWVTIILFLLGGILLIPSAIAALHIGAGAYMLFAMGAVYFASAAILLFAPAVRTYFSKGKDKQDEQPVSETNHKNQSSNATNK